MRLVLATLLFLAAFSVAAPVAEAEFPGCNAEPVIGQNAWHTACGYLGCYWDEQPPANWVAECL